MAKPQNLLPYAVARYAGRSCGAVCTEHKNKAAVRQPCLLSTFDSIYLISPVFSGSQGSFSQKRTLSGAWGEAPYIMVLGRGMGQSTAYDHVSSSGRPKPATSAAGAGAAGTRGSGAVAVPHCVHQT